jgi:hypothetical protein
MPEKPSLQLVNTRAMYGSDIRGHVHSVRACMRVHSAIINVEFVMFSDGASKFHGTSTTTDEASEALTRNRPFSCLHLQVDRCHSLY